MSGSSAGLSALGSAMPHTRAVHGVARRPGAEQQRLALALHDGQRQLVAVAGEPAQQRPDAKLVGDRREAGDDGASRRLRMRGSRALAVATASAARTCASRSVPRATPSCAPAVPSSLEDVSDEVSRHACRHSAPRPRRRAGTQAQRSESMQSRMSRASVRSRWPYKCRWAPFIRGHDPGQGQLPCGSYRPPGHCSRRTPQPCMGRILRRVRKKSMSAAVIPASAKRVERGSSATAMRDWGWIPALRFAWRV